MRHKHTTFCDASQASPAFAIPRSPAQTESYLLRSGSDDAPLRRPHVTARPLPVRQYACAQPFLDEPHDAPVRYPVLAELHQAFVVDGIEETPNVRIQHPVHVLSMDPDTECVQCVVRPASWPEPIREAEEVRLVDAVQDRRERTLDQFVLERGNSERPLASVRLRDEHPPNRLRPIPPALQPPGEVDQVCLQLLSVRPPRLPVHSRCR